MHEADDSLGRREDLTVSCNVVVSAYPHQLNMSVVDVFIGNNFVVDPDVYQVWVNGYSGKDFVIYVGDITAIIILIRLSQWVRLSHPPWIRVSRNSCTSSGSQEDVATPTNAHC